MLLKGSKLTALAFLALAGLIALNSGFTFREMFRPEPIVRGPGVSEVKHLSDYFPGLKGTAGDTEVYVLAGKKAGGTALILGGTHPNEPAGFLAAVLLIENAIPFQGRLLVIPRANNSGFTHTDPQEGTPQKFTIKTPSGERWFRFGSRATNPVDQWPDPDIYIHAASGQQLSGSEVRNLNRAYPGRPDGNLTEKVAYGIVQLIKAEKVDLTIDLHEASPEYPVIHATVAHDRAVPMAAEVTMSLQLEGVEMGLEPSPVNFHGLSHRELGDYTDTLAILMESANPAQGRLRGRTDEALVVKGQDKEYVQAAKLGRLFVTFDQKGHPLEERVGRHTTAVADYLEALGRFKPGADMVIGGIPKLPDLQAQGLGSFLKPVN